ncbi:N-acetyltransferase GNAT family [Penicillium angulare]|uniref:N-acetyltransferase GNAT family n=1 Tax=Penicillium angulare TaxID=116970 RepID=A0A9W9KIL3_9EURO|nr:N-acetyltransferase GNAT family [Penicillium angulare]
MVLEFLPNQSVRVIIPATGPTIESDRLLLRPVAERDVPALFAVRARPEVAKTNYPKTPFKSIEETKEWLASKIFEGSDEVNGRSFNYSIVDKSIPESEEQVIGYVSVNSLNPCPDIGYSYIPESWGKGYATEALQLLLKMWWALPRRDPQIVDGVMEDPERIFAISEKENAASCRVLTKCGFKVKKDFTYEDTDLYLWTSERPETL